MCAFDFRFCQWEGWISTGTTPPFRPVGGSANSGVTALLCSQGQVLCRGSNRAGQLGVGDRSPRSGLQWSAALLPWPAAALFCGDGFTVALRRGGTAVCSWGTGGHGQLGRGGDSTLPVKVRGLPEGDPVVLLEVGDLTVIAVTRSGAAYGWGWNRFALLPGVTDLELHAPVRIAALSGRGLRRLALGVGAAAAETEAGELLGWGTDLGSPAAPVRLRTHAFCTASLAFPLRSLVAIPGPSGLVAADAGGRLWGLRKESGQLALLLSPTRPARRLCVGKWLPASEEQVVRLFAAAYLIALTAEGRLWGRLSGTWTDLTAKLRLPQWLQPCRSIKAGHITLIQIQDPGWRSRCRLLLLAAERRALLPRHVWRGALVPFLVEEDYIIEH